MSRMVWFSPNGFRPLVHTSGLPAAGPGCCCEVEVCTAEVKHWATINVDEVDERGTDEPFYLDPGNIPHPAVGDASNGGTVYGGPKRLAHFALRWTDVDVPQGHVFGNVSITFDVAQSPLAYSPVECGTPIDVGIVGYDIGDAPPISGASPITMESIRTTQRTPNWIDWNAAPKPDPVDCGTPTITTPNIAAVLNDIVGRPDWVSGNALVIIFEGKLQVITVWFGAAILKRFDRTLTRNDGGSFIADGFEPGQMLQVDVPGDPPFVTCVNTVTADTLFWSTVPATWPVNGTEFVSITVYPTACPGFPGASRPSTATWDYAILVDNLSNQHCLTAQ